MTAKEKQESKERWLKGKTNKEWNNLKVAPTDEKEQVGTKGKNLVVLTNEKTKEKEVVR